MGWNTELVLFSDYLEERFIFPIMHLLFLFLFLFLERQLVRKATSKSEKWVPCWLASMVVTKHGIIRQKVPWSAAGLSFTEIDFSSFYVVLSQSTPHFMGKRERSWNVFFDLLFELLPSLESTMKSASLQCCVCPGSQFGFILAWMLSTDRVWFLLTTILVPA